MQHQEKDYILSVLAQNHAGVLQRVVGLFSRRCYNIKSIMAAQTEDPNQSRILIVVQGDDRIVRQVDKQLSKLAEVEQVTVLDRNEAVVREHLLIKLRRSDETSDRLVALANVFHAAVLHVSGTEMILELTGTPSALDSFVTCCKPYSILSILRTGTMAMEQ